MSEIELFAKSQELLLSGTPFVMVTLVSIKGSAPQDLGAKVVSLCAKGFYWGP